MVSPVHLVASTEFYFDSLPPPGYSGAGPDLTGSAIIHSTGHLNDHPSGTVHLINILVYHVRVQSNSEVAISILQMPVLFPQTSSLHSLLLVQREGSHCSNLPITREVIRVNMPQAGESGLILR